MFYAPDIATTLTLPEQESQHAVRVLRLAVGDPLQVIDGRGNLYDCHIVTAHQKRCAVAIDGITPTPTHWRHNITVAIAPTKLMDRLEWAVEKMVEMGVDRIVPILTDHSERRALKTERLHRIAVAAIKQSLKAVLPVIDPLTPMADFVAGDNNAQRFIAYCDPALPRDERQLLAGTYDAGTDVTILIGPEGDFSPDEVTAALAAGYRPVSLGDSRLRTETAAVKAVAAVHTIDERVMASK